LSGASEFTSFFIIDNCQLFLGLYVFKIYNKIFNVKYKEAVPIFFADFESRSEIDRWTGDADFSIDHETYYHGKASLKVELNTSLYSGVGLKYFPENWQHYNELQLSIFNPDSEPLQLTCRIHDRQHTRGLQLYADRFNRKFSISSGWNLIRIELQDIENAPHKRKMALNEIQGLGIFATSLSKQKTVYVDYVRLVN